MTNIDLLDTDTIRTEEPSEPYRHSCGHLVVMWPGGMLEDADRDGPSGTEHECEEGDSDDLDPDPDEEYAERWSHTKPIEEDLPEDPCVEPSGDGNVIPTPNDNTEEPTVIKVTRHETQDDYEAGLENDHLDNGHPVPVADCPMCENTEAAIAANERQQDIDDHIAGAHIGFIAGCPLCEDELPTGRRNISHKNCDHPSTKAARAKCRKVLRDFNAANNITR